MTAIFYHDCECRSPDGRWLATALSPHNGRILCRDGTVPKGDFAYEYRQHQSQFRYQLQSPDGQIVWERWQGKEESPGELVLSNRGTLVIRTHGFAPELIVVLSDGNESIRVGIGSIQEPIDANEDSQNSIHERVLVDTADFTTAGVFWTAHSFPYFAEIEGSEFFVWRTRHGQRIIIDARRGVLLRTPDIRIDSALTVAERTQASRLLRLFASRMDEVETALASSSASDLLKFDLKQEIGKLTGAITICGEARAIESVHDLTTLAALKWDAYSTSTTCAKNGTIEVQHLRPAIYHALRLMNVVPPQLPCYYFRIGETRIEFSEYVHDRFDRLTQVRRNMNCQDILRLIGPPDFVDRYSVKNGRFYVWPERWEYDELNEDGWQTTTIKWEEGLFKNTITQITSQHALWTTSADRIRKIQSH
jgi:hypothetical protein